ncbi:MAG: hypothetical protein LBL94_05395, partial [Prevotellaceae bacterium]|nr:hypothetical protein [Prevotellaceae bacterium]
LKRRATKIASVPDAGAALFQPLICIDTSHILFVINLFIEYYMIKKLIFARTILHLLHTPPVGMPTTIGTSFFLPSDSFLRNEQKRQFEMYSSDDG